MKHNKKIFLFSCIALLVFNSCKDKPAPQEESPFQQSSATYTLLENETAAPKAFAVTTNIHVILDSLSGVKFMDSLKNGRQLLQIDGIAHFIIDHAPQPVVIYTGMMKLTTQNADFEINAYNESPGQSLKVFHGQLIATKAYQSDFPNTDTLEKGGMILINRDIDLMEKETFDTAIVSPMLDITPKKTDSLP